jgi:DNA-binding NarL/FixJ family response regulator
VLLVGDRLLVDALSVVVAADEALAVVDTLRATRLDADVIADLEPNILLFACSSARPDVWQFLSTQSVRFPRLRVLVVTPTFDRETLAACLNSGAGGYLTHEASAAELVQAIKRVHAGEVMLAADPPQRLLRTPRGPRGAVLAPRELAVLSTLATGATTEEAAAQLSITVHTLRTHLRNAMSKLRTHSKLGAILIAIKTGQLTLPDNMASERPEYDEHRDDQRESRA